MERRGPDAHDRATVRAFFMTMALVERGRDVVTGLLWVLGGRPDGDELDDVVVEAFELAGVAAAVLTEGVEVFQGGGIDGNAGGFGVDFIQGAPVADDFLLGTVAGAGVAEDERAQAVAVQGDASMRLEDSALWMMAVSRKARRIWGDWRV